MDTKSLLSKIRKSKKELADVMKSGGDALLSDITYYISTQAAMIDWAISQPGFPAGAVTTLFGREGSGKSSLVYHALCEVQAQGGLGVLIDSEQRFTRDRFKAMGGDPDQLIIIDGSTMEQAIESITTTIDVAREEFPKDMPMLVAYDSLAGSVPEKRLTADVGKSLPGIAASLVGEELPKLKLKIANTGVALVIVNQLRSNIAMHDPRSTSHRERQKVMGVDYSMLAQWPLLYYSSLMLYVQNVSPILDKTDKDIQIGITSRVTNRKCGIGPGEGRKAEFDLLHASGIDLMTSRLTLLEKLGNITQGGGWYSYEGEKFRAKDFVDVWFKYPELADFCHEAPTLWRTAPSADIQEGASGDDDIDTDVFSG